jgi:hypothetical protein
LWPSVEAACDAVIEPVHVTEPDAATAARYEDFYQTLYRPLYDELKSQYARAAEFVARYAGA